MTAGVLGNGGRDGTAPVSLLTTTVGLSRALRARGVTVTPAESVDAVRTLEAVDLTDRREVRLALRAVLTGSKEDFAAFDEAFDEAWRERGATQAPDDTAQRSPSSKPSGKSRTRRREPEATVFLKQWLDRAAATEAEPLKVPTMSDIRGAGQSKLAGFTDDELDELERIAQRIARRLANRKSRRWSPASRGGRVDLRRTLRRLSTSGGDLVELRFRERAPRKTRLVVLCDVSGSMELHARLLLQFLFALQRVFARVETFVFSTHLERITDSLRSGTYKAALDRLSQDVDGWSGGTRIGESLKAFNRSWRGLVDRKTVVVVLSDGWDTGPPALLGAELAAIRRRAGRVVWLNPLLGSAGYEPLTGGMTAALPHVDVFAPCHDMVSLAALARHFDL